MLDNVRYEVEKIIGAGLQNEELFYFIKLKDVQKLEMIQAKDANSQIPMTVISYLEDRLVMGCQRTNLLNRSFPMYNV